MGVDPKGEQHRGHVAAVNFRPARKLVAASMRARRARRIGRQLTSALVLAATGGALFAASADAQIFERRQDFFPFSLFGDRGPPPPSAFPGFRGIPPPSESAKAPPPRKPETPPTSTVLVIGNSLADWLAYGLEEALTDTPEIGVVRENSAVLRSRPLRSAQRGDRMAAGRQGGAGGRTAEHHRRDARPE